MIRGGSAAMADWIGEGGRWLRGIGVAGGGAGGRGGGGMGGGARGRGEEEGDELLAEILSRMKAHSDAMQALVERQQEIESMAVDESTRRELPEHIRGMTVSASLCPGKCAGRTRIAVNLACRHARARRMPKSFWVQSFQSRPDRLLSRPGPGQDIISDGTLLFSPPLSLLPFRPMRKGRRRGSRGRV